MPLIHLTTFIAAPVERVFDLSRSIDLHKKSLTETGELAVAGVTTGLIQEGETVTWKAHHLLKTRILKIKIVSMNRPVSFTDQMVQGDFKTMKHEHHFKPVENGTFMIDLFYFEIPYGALGKLLGRFYLLAHMKKLLLQRNRFIKEIAETNRWQQFLK